MNAWSLRSLVLRCRQPLSMVAVAFLLVACGGGESEDPQAQVAADDERQRALAVTAVSGSSGPPASVCFFEGANYTGASFCVSASATGMPAGFDNAVSSIRVPTGVRVVLYDGVRQTGRSLSLTADVAQLSLNSFDNAASSFTIGPTGASMPAGTTYYWSNPATWGGTKPSAGAAVLVSAGMNLVLDENTAPLGVLTIEGTVSFRAGVSAELRASDVIVRNGGALLAGSSVAPFTGKAIITLTNTTMTADPSGAGMGARGLLVYNGGKLALFGKPPAVPWTRIAADASAGATTLQLNDAVSWTAGDQIVVAPTEWYPLNTDASQASHDAVIQTELRTLASSSSSSKTATLSTGLSAFKWGRLQYMTDAGLSLSPGTFTKPHVDAVSTLDERAEVGNLTRNIVIQGADDSLWSTNNFGGHVMVMNRSSMVNLDGVEFRRMGQAGRVGRYPLHWHLLSYNSAGTELGDATGHFVRNSAIWNSRQRCIVIHGTNGVEVRNNICYDIKGHAIFLEDAVERRNVIEGNLVLRVRSPLDTQVIAEHERRYTAGGCGGAASGYWLTNPDNTVRNNTAADAQGNGFWLSYPTVPKKDNKKVAIRPVNLPHAAFEYNTARANGFFGIMLECALRDDLGNIELLKYSPTTTGSEYVYTNAQRFTLRGLAMIKNRNGGYLNRATVPDYRQFVVSGNMQRSISGSVDAGTFKHALVVANSLNDRQPYPTTGFEPQFGIASYHSQMDITDNTFVAFQNKGYVLTQNGWDRASGTFGTDDYYIRAVEKGYLRNTNNKLVNSDPGYRAIPPHLQSNYTVASNNNWTLAGAIWDPQGIVGTANRYWVLDSPFLKDSSCTALKSKVPLNAVSNGLSCAGPYFGVEMFWLNRGLAGETGQWGLMEKLSVTRTNASNQTVGSWVVEQGYTSTTLGSMRHFAALKGDRYVVRFPGFPYAATTKTSPSWLQFQVTNLLNSTDSLIVAVQFLGTVTPSRVFASTNPDYAKFTGVDQDSILFTKASSQSALLSGSGHQWWQDKANNLVWLKLAPLGLTAPYSWAAPGSDWDIYRAYQVRLEP